MSGPLEGVRVLELGVLIAGPFAGRLLADFGAEVVKVEEPRHGDPLREWGQLRHEGRPLWWPVQSRNKKLVTLDLRHERGRDLLLRLAERADVLVENFRPGTLERWGLGPEDLWRANPGLIIARISGYGQTGPYAGRPGFAVAGEAMGGLRYINGYPGQAPPRTGISLGDSLAAMFAVQGILMALYRRDTQPVGDRRGQVIDASIMESCFALLESAVPEYGKLGHVRQPSGTGLAKIAPSNVYRARDGRWVVIGAWVAERDAAEVDRLMNEHGIVCGPVYTIADIFADTQYRARDMLVEMEDPELGTITAPGIVPRLSETPGEARWTGSWRLGCHNDEVYGCLLGFPNPRNPHPATAISRGPRVADGERRALAEEGVI